MQKEPLDFHKPFLVSLLVIVVFVFGFGVIGKTQKNVNQNGAAVALSKTTTTAGPPNPGQTVAQKVIVTGGGSVSSNGVWQTTDGTTWTTLTSNAQFPGRLYHSTVYFNNKLYILGGYSTVANTDVNDVWSSSNGVNWTRVISHAPWRANHALGAIVFKNKLWVLGGCFNPSPSIWNTNDGVTWTQIIPNGGGSNVPTSCIDSVAVYGNSMWAFGDPNSTGSLALWKSSDGISWVNLGANLPLNQIGNTGTNPKLVSSMGKLWWIGGNAYWTTDGLTWTQSYSAGLLPVAQHILYTLNNSIFTTGGFFVAPVSPDDIFSTTDGVNWNQTIINLSPWHPLYTDAVNVPATFGLPDLVVSSLTFDPSSLKQSHSPRGVVYTFTVKNNGGTAVTLPAGFKFILKETSPVSRTIGEVSGTGTVLAPGNGTVFYSRIAQYSSPLFSTLGPVQVSLVADSTNLVTESDETNNTTAGSFTIIP
jgi:hypothetical protein